MVDYTFSNAQFPVDVQGKTLNLKFSEANKILTEYCRECLPVYSTLAFFEVFNKQPAFDSLPMLNNQKFESAVSLYQNLYHSTDVAEVKNTLSFYIADPSSLASWFDLRTTEAKLTDLRNSLKEIEARYRKRLFDEVLATSAKDGKGNPLDAKAIKWFTEQKAGKILNEEAVTFFIQRADDEMALDIKVEFAKNQLRALMFYADPIISDPRFRMSLEDSRWNEYDETIKKEVTYYNQKFSGRGDGFVPLDWRYVKAMLWTECLAGPGSVKNIKAQNEWNGSPMQIGRRAADAGYIVVSGKSNDSDTERTFFVTPTELRQAIQGKSKMVGHLNVRAGIAYLYIVAIVSMVDKPQDTIDDTTVLTYTYQKSDKGLDSIAKKLGTTSRNIAANSGITLTSILHAGDILRYQKAKADRVPSGWVNWKIAIVDKYNYGDPLYELKVDNAYRIITSRTAK